MDKVLIIDFMNLYIKYYWVYKHSYESMGTEEVHKKHVQGLTRFFSLIEKNNKDYSKIYLVLDCARNNTDNKELFEDYKEGRIKEDGINKNLDKVISLLSIVPRFTILKNNKKEADEVIAYLALKHGKNSEVTIYSNDKDFLQLTANPNISITEKYEKGKFLILKDDDIFSKFKNSKKEDFRRISTNKSDIIKYRTFKGDKSDNISAAVPRLLDKDIIYIIQNCWKESYLDKEVYYHIVDAIDKEPLKNKVKEYRDNILRNYQLMNLSDKINDEVIKNETRAIKIKNLNEKMQHIIDIAQEFEVNEFLFRK